MGQVGGGVLRLGFGDPREQLQGHPGPVVGIGERRGVGLLAPADEEETADTGDDQDGEHQASEQELAGQAGVHTESGQPEAGTLYRRRVHVIEPRRARQVPIWHWPRSPATARSRRG